MQLASWQGREDSHNRRFPVQLDGSSVLESAAAHFLTLPGGEGRLSRDCDAGSPVTATRSVRDDQSSVRANERPCGRRAEINSSHGTHIRSFTAPSLITCWQTADSTDGKRGETRAGAGGRGGTATVAERTAARLCGFELRLVRRSCPTECAKCSGRLSCARPVRELRDKAVRSTSSL